MKQDQAIDNECPNGILLVDKACGITSHGVVSYVRRRFGIKKVGHAGTLDPNATGVLVILIGKATKLSATFLNQDKEYRAVMKLGVRTDSGDLTGEVIKTGEVKVSASDVVKTVESFSGEIEQVPPMFSAKKVDGKKLYKLARKGIEIKRQPVKITIKEIEVMGVDMPMVTFRVVCTKGTYVRQLADDMGEKLKVGASLMELRRTRSGDFDLSSSVTMDELSKMDKKTLYENISRI